VNTIDKLDIGGVFYFKHYRNGKLIDSGNDHNVFIKEGLVYALNAGFGVPVGGAPSPINSFYVGLATANRAWSGDETGATIHATSLEAEGYSQSARPEWTPQALADTSNIELSDAGAEVAYDITVGTTVYGAFMIDKSAKDGTSDTGSVLVAGANFTAPRLLEINDVFKVGYTLSAQSGT